MSHIKLSEWLVMHYIMLIFTKGGFGGGEEVFFNLTVVVIEMTSELQASVLVSFFMYLIQRTAF